MDSGDSGWAKLKGSLENISGPREQDCVIQTLRGCPQLTRNAIAVLVHWEQFNTDRRARGIVHVLRDLVLGSPDIGREIIRRIIRCAVNAMTNDTHIKSVHYARNAATFERRTTRMQQFLRGVAVDGRYLSDVVSMLSRKIGTCDSGIAVAFAVDIYTETRQGEEILKRFLLEVRHSRLGIQHAMRLFEMMADADCERFVRGLNTVYHEDRSPVGDMRETVVDVAARLSAREDRGATLMRYLARNRSPILRELSTRVCLGTHERDCGWRGHRSRNIHERLGRYGRADQPFART